MNDGKTGLATARASMKKKAEPLPTLAWFKEFARERGGSCLTKALRSPSQLLEFVCAEGHAWLGSRAGAHRSRAWCPDCAKQALAERRARASIQPMETAQVLEFHARDNAPPTEHCALPIRAL